MQKVKIKTSGIKAILKSIGYETNIIINRIHRGYKTTLVALKDDALIEMHLILKESLFRSDSSVKIRFYDIKKDHEVVVTKDIDNTDYKVLSRGIVDALEEANKETKLFLECVLKLIHLSLVDTKSIKDYYSAQKRIEKVYKLADIIK